MKNYLAVFTGTQAKLDAFRALDERERTKREEAGITAWSEWATTHAPSIVEMGGPLGKTKRTAADGVSDIRNNLAGYTVVRAESHDAAAKLFLEHPHFTIFPGDAVEIMECLSIPNAAKK
jgi:hypothetical protein